MSLACTFFGHKFVTRVLPIELRLIAVEDLDSYPEAIAPFAVFECERCGDRAVTELYPKIPDVLKERAKKWQQGIYDFSYHEDSYLSAYVFIKDHQLVTTVAKAIEIFGSEQVSDEKPRLQLVAGRDVAKA